MLVLRPSKSQTVILCRQEFQMIDKLETEHEILVSGVLCRCLHLGTEVPLTRSLWERRWHPSRPHPRGAPHHRCSALTTAPTIVRPLTAHPTVLCFALHSTQSLCIVMRASHSLLPHPSAGDPCLRSIRDMESGSRDKQTNSPNLRFSDRISKPLC